MRLRGLLRIGLPFLAIFLYKAWKVHAWEKALTATNYNIPLRPGGLE